MMQFLVKYHLAEINQTKIKLLNTEKEAENAVKYAQFLKADKISIYWIDFQKQKLERIAGEE